MKNQIGVIVPDEGMQEDAIENYKQGYRDRYENVDTVKQKPLKLEFIDQREDDQRWIEVWGE